MDSNYTHTLLLVDDEASILKALQRLFRKEGYKILTAEGGREALETLEQVQGPVSLIISDQRMPAMNGSKFLEQSVPLAPDAMRFLLTGYSDLEAVADAVNKGRIHRYITKPWNDSEMLRLVQDALEQVELKLENKRLTRLTEKQNEELAQLNKQLEKKVSERTWALQYQNKTLRQLNHRLDDSLVGTIRLLTLLVESSNPEIGRLMKEVAHLSREIAKETGIDEKEQIRIEMAGLVHDVGLLGASDVLLEKDKKFMNRQEFEVYSQHPTIAALSLSSVYGLKDIAEIVQCHHEYVDGSGFPRGLNASQIPVGAKILAVAVDYHTIIQLWPKDVQGLMANARRYLDARTLAGVELDEETLRRDIAESVILHGAGTRYDQKIVECFRRVMSRQRPHPNISHLQDHQIKAGMILMQDLRFKDGRLLLSRGTTLNERCVQSIQNIGMHNLMDGPIAVAPGSQEPTGRSDDHDSQ